MSADVQFRVINIAEQTHEDIISGLGRKRGSAGSNRSEVDHSDHYESSTDKTESMTQQHGLVRGQSPESISIEPQLRSSRQKRPRESDQRPEQYRSPKARVSAIPVQLAPLPPMDGMAQQSGNRDYDYIDHVNRQKYELESQLKVWKERCRGLEQERESLHAQMQIFFAMAAETAPQLLENIRMQLSRRVQDSAPIPNYGPGKLPSMRPDKPILQPMLTQPSAGKTRAVSQSRMSGQQEGMVARQQRTGPSPFQPHVSIAPPLQGMHSAGMPMQPSSTSMQPMLAPLRPSTQAMSARPLSVSYSHPGNMHSSQAKMSGLDQRSHPPQRATYPIGIPSLPPLSRPLAAKMPSLDHHSISKSAGPQRATNASAPSLKVSSGKKSSKVSAPVPIRPKPIYQPSLPGAGDSSAFRVVKSGIPNVSPTDPSTSPVPAASKTTSSKPPTEKLAPLPPRRSAPMPNGAAAIFEMAKNQAALGKRW